MLTPRVGRPDGSRSWHDRDPRWDRRAACSTSPLGADAWWCDQGRLREAAILTCLSCPVRLACAEWAISDPDLIGGIFGGLGHEQRQDERRRRKEASAAEVQRRRELHREPARRAEQRRRDLGLAESSEDRRKRWASASPEQQRQRAERAAARYEAHKDEIAEKRRKARAHPAA
jgi:hypothetical protein